MSVVHIIPGPTKVLKRQPAKERWCFECRKRERGEWVLLADEDPMSYYEPVWAYYCDGCNKDGRYFPGTGPL